MLYLKWLSYPRSSGRNFGPILIKLGKTFLSAVGSLYNFADQKNPLIFNPIVEGYQPLPFNIWFWAPKEYFWRKFSLRTYNINFLADMVKYKIIYNDKSKSVLA